FNRISMGVQDFNADVQKAVNRIQPWEMTQATVTTARELGYGSVNIDLNPDRVALFNFAYLPEMVRHQRVLKPEQFPAPADKLAMLRRGIERLTGAGWVFIGMDHFARPDDELAVAQANGTLGRNFQGYTTRAGLDLFGFGVSAISQIGPTYSQNMKTLDTWRVAIESGSSPVWRGIELSEDDLVRRDLIMELMCQFELDRARFAARHGIDFDARFAPELLQLGSMADDGLVQVTPERITILPAGRLLVRNIAMTFDAYLSEGAARRYSRTV
ncbi:MAG: oxygen-independent coproporphyrinogen III oxidase, partial [bacterium]